jgi:hypothetical protein
MGPYELIIIIITLAPFAIIYYFVRHKIKTFNIFNHPTKGYIAVKVGFSFPAMFFHFMWMLTKGLILLAIFYLIVGTSVTAYLDNNFQTGDDAIVSIAIIIYLILWFYPGFKGNEWLVKKYMNQGCEFVTTLSALNKKAAIMQARDNEDISDLFPSAEAIEDYFDENVRSFNNVNPRDRGTLMTKGTRRAIVFSIAGFILILILNNGDYDLRDILIPMTPIFIYWGYRFIKGR